MNEAQRQVYDAVCARGYRVGWTPDAFIGRQVLKAHEELAEAAACLRTAVQHTVVNGFVEESQRIGQHARALFNSRAALKWLTLTDEQREHLKAELADVAVTLFCAAEELGFDVVQGAVAKATADIERGVT